MNNRILAIDPHPITLKGYDSMLSDEPDLSLSKAVTTGAEGLAYVREHDVELALTELRFQEGGGFELVKQLDTAAPNLDVLIVSCCEATAFGSRTLQAGAQGYLQKDEATETLLEAIRTVLAGGVYLNSSLQEMTVRRYAEGNSGRALAPLTDRELEVFNAIGAGASTREIGEYLHISMKTVQTHRANIMEKLGFESKEKLIQYAAIWTLENAPCTT